MIVKKNKKEMDGNLKTVLCTFININKKTNHTRSLFNENMQVKHCETPLHKICKVFRLLNNFFLQLTGRTHCAPAGKRHATLPEAYS